MSRQELCLGHGESGLVDFQADMSSSLTDQVQAQGESLDWKHTPGDRWLSIAIKVMGVWRGKRRCLGTDLEDQTLGPSKLALEG